MLRLMFIRLKSLSVGLALGVEFKDGFCSVCEFNGVTSYEVTGQVGFLIGAGVGFVVTA